MPPEQQALAGLHALLLVVHQLLGQGAGDALKQPDGQPGPLRRLVEALLKPALEQPLALRGDVRYYETPDIAINITTRPDEEEIERVWTIYGKVYPTSGKPLTKPVEQVTLREQAPEAEAQRALVEQDGSFVLEGVLTGHYSLSVVTSREEIIIRQLTIGDPI